MLIIDLIWLSVDLIWNLWFWFISTWMLWCVLVRHFLCRAAVRTWWWGQVGASLVSGLMQIWTKGGPRHARLSTTRHSLLTATLWSTASSAGPSSPPVELPSSSRFGYFAYLNVFELNKTLSSWRWSILRCYILFSLRENVVSPDRNVWFSWQETKEAGRTVRGQS